MKEYPWTIRMVEQNWIIRRVRHIRRVITGWKITTDDSGEKQIFYCQHYRTIISPTLLARLY